MAYTIYKHTSPSGKSYIGQTNNVSQREASHKIPSSKCTAFRNAIQKYGWDNFTHQVLAQNLTLTQANEQEERLISEHNTLAPGGYNLRSGGQNQLISEEVKRKWSETRKGRPRSPEHQAKLNAAARLRVRTPEHQAKLVEAAKRVRTEETRRKLSVALMGRVKTDEHRRKISETTKGKVLSEDTKAKMLAKQTGRRMYMHILTGQRKYFYPDQFTTIPLDSWRPVV